MGFSPLWTGFNRVEGSSISNTTSQWASFPYDDLNETVCDATSVSSLNIEDPDNTVAAVTVTESDTEKS